MKDVRELKIILGFILFFFIAGVMVFHHIEDWTFVETIYFVSATLTTVGYGDVTPETDAGRILAVIFMWIGVTIVLTAASFIGSSFIEKRIEKKIEEESKKEK